MKKSGSFARFVMGCAAFAFTVASTGMLGVISTPRTAEASLFEKFVDINSNILFDACANADGDQAIAIGSATAASGDNSVAIGNLAEATSADSIAVGRYSKATSSESIGIGHFADAAGVRSVAAGARSYAAATDATAIGYNAVATSEASLAAGDRSLAKGELSSAVGYRAKTDTDASGSVALGANSYATESDTISVGNADEGYYRRIVNVADATDAHDAVTLGQLQNGSTNINVGTLQAGDVVADVVRADDVVTNNVQVGGVTINGGSNTIKTGNIKINGSTNIITGVEVDREDPSSVVNQAELTAVVYIAQHGGEITPQGDFEIARDITIGDVKIDADTNKITGVEDGGVYKGSKEVVNGGQLYTMQEDINRVDKNVGYVGAHAAAMSALHPVPYNDSSRTTVTAGFGNYRGEQGYALGVFHYLGEDALANAAMSYNTGGDVMSRVGISFALGKKERKTVTKVSSDEMEMKLAEQEQVISELQNNKTAQDKKIEQLMKTVELLNSRLSEVEKKK